MSTRDPLDPALYQRNEHHALFAELRRQGPIHRHDTADGQGMWSVVTHPEVTAVNRDATRFSSELGGITVINHHEIEGSIDQRGTNLIFTDPPRHTRLRKLVSSGFTPRVIGRLEQLLADRIARIVDDVIERGECEFVSDLAAELPLQTIAEMMGVPLEDRQRLFAWSNAMIGMDDPDYEGNPTEAAIALNGYVAELIDQRASEPRDDVLGTLLRAEIEGEKLSLEEVQAFMLLLGVAGSETTRTATSRGVLALIEHPEAHRWLCDDLEARLPAAIEEILRWTSPVMHFRRTATVDTELAGQAIARGDRVVMWLVSANYDEDVFGNPEQLELSRSPNPHVAFGGGGIHFCLGASLARTQLRLVFRELLTRMPDIELTAPPRMLCSNFVAGVKQMPVRFTPGRRVVTKA